MADLVPAIAGLEVSARSSEDMDRPKLEPQVTSISVDSKSSDLSPGNELSSVGITELLDLDDRPTFENLWLVRLVDGRAAAFTEWFMVRKGTET